MKTAVFISSERSLRQWRIRLTVGAISKSRFQIQGGGEIQGIIPRGLPRFNSIPLSGLGSRACPGG